MKSAHSYTGCLNCDASPPHLEHAAGAALAEACDAVQVVGGDGLILLLDEAEGREVEAGLLTLAVLQHGGELIYGAPFNRGWTSQVPHLHMDTCRQCINGRKVGRRNQTLPLDLKVAELQLVCYFFCQGLKLKKEERLDFKLDSNHPGTEGDVWNRRWFTGHGQSSLRKLRDLRDKQVKEGGVGWLRVHRGVTPVQENKVSVEKEWGPQHRVRDSRSQVESSNLQSIKAHSWKVADWWEKGVGGGWGEAKFRHTGFQFLQSVCFSEQPGPAFIKRLKACSPGVQTTPPMALSVTHGDRLIPQVAKWGKGGGLPEGYNAELTASLEVWSRRWTNDLT